MIDSIGLLRLWALGLAVALIGCEVGRSADKAESGADSPGAMDVVTFTASDYAYSGPSQVPAGLTAIRLVNTGSELHHLQIVKLAEGKGLQDLLSAMAEGHHPDWASFRGGPNAVEPGAELASVQNLEPGRYAMVCIIPSPDGVLHLMKGMVGEFEVVEAEGAGPAEVEADLTMELVDYGFQLSSPLTSGEHTMRVVNSGVQFHEVVIARLNPGKSSSDFMAWGESGFQGPPPVTFVGGLVGLDVGKEAYFTANYEPGKYLLLCFLPDHNDGKMHIEHGMMKLIEVM